MKTIILYFLGLDSSKIEKLPRHFNTRETLLLTDGKPLDIRTVASSTISLFSPQDAGDQFVLIVTGGSVSQVVRTIAKLMEKEVPFAVFEFGKENRIPDFLWHQKGSIKFQNPKSNLERVEFPRD